MAGSTTSIDTPTTKTTKTATIESLPQSRSNHSGGGHQTYRVTIDVSRIQANVFAAEGGRLTELAVRNWLRSVGFHPEVGGATWIADRDSLSRLDQSEIVRAERVHA
jgi:hypothetical protein